MAKFYLDTEFNGWGGDTISIGLAPADKSLPEFYYVLPLPTEPTEWVAANVLTKLAAKGYEGYDYEAGEYPYAERGPVGRELARFLHVYGGEEVIIQAEWPEDFAHFNKLMLNGPGSSWNFPDITFKLKFLKGFNPADHAAVPHNALEDARALRDYCEGSKPKR